MQDNVGSHPQIWGGGGVVGSALGPSLQRYPPHEICCRAGVPHYPPHYNGERRVDWTRCQNAPASMSSFGMFNGMPKQKSAQKAHICLVLGGEGVRSFLVSSWIKLNQISQFLL